ncbi:Hypothetical predicted protein, partial [Paramuricea clavata]
MRRPCTSHLAYGKETKTCRGPACPNWTEDDSRSFLIDTASPVSLVPLSFVSKTSSPKNSGLVHAGGGDLRFFGETSIRPVFFGKCFNFMAKVSDVIHPILGRDFFDGPGSDILLDPHRKKYFQRRQEIVSVVTENDVIKAGEEKTVVSNLRPQAKDFIPRPLTENSCVLAANEIVKNFTESVNAKPVSEFPALFAPIRIDTGEHSPVYSKARPLFGEKLAAVGTILEDLQAKGIIVPTSGNVEWASPIHMVTKSD